ncbi:hypothetical protein HZH66_012391 [Vespula vulgaris]|uniref:mRNA-decapping enzyme C-terminal domain-containing protein n=1 Tax=Vespula vulgaris TaxID=7454 RepID=A0A834J8Y6_VESVU|nr:hypothetical protein HZH66_012391 [Vespula vulgaris]
MASREDQWQRLLREYVRISERINDVSLNVCYGVYKKQLLALLQNTGLVVKIIRQYDGLDGIENEQTATHVALYTFNGDNNEWEKTDIEGALFVYSRNGEPYNSILIMNRLNTNNLVEPVTQGLDLQLQAPFLLYRNSRCNIYGIWFYDKEECIRIAAMLYKLVMESEKNRKAANKPSIQNKKNAGSNANNVDIFSMLSKAQEDFNTNRANSGGPDVTSQSVMDFFAKAKVNTGHFKAGDQPTAINTGPNENKPLLLARLMSHPAAHTLEHIEKQQRSITPQPSTLQSQTPAPSTTSINVDLQPSVNQSTSETNGSSGFLRIQSPTNTTSSNMTNHQTSTIITPSNTNPLASLFAHVSGNTASEDIITTPALSGTGSAPALIPPVMFAAPSPAEPLARPLEPLTRNQLLQAFNYLLRSDPDFINKLHEAYVKSRLPNSGKKNELEVRTEID